MYLLCNKGKCYFVELFIDPVVRVNMPNYMAQIKIMS